MKKMLIFILFFFILLLFSSSCYADFGVNPRELSISMTDGFLNGNTSVGITVFNNNENEDVNISWYLSDPDPISTIRPNKTTIPDISWIDLDPKWQIIPPKDSAIFYIQLQIPEKLENLNKNWESWITFKSETTGLFIFEHAVRLYIDTPTNSSAVENTVQVNESNNNMLIIVAVAFLLIFFMIFLVRFYFIKK